MSDYRLRLTIDEARHLFHSMMQDMRRVCADSCTSTLNKFMPDSEAQQRFEDIWPRVEDELRKTYELCRFALDVEDLEDSEDVEVFRGFCEDYDGVDELDFALFDRVSEEVAEINHALEVRAGYRAKIPAKMENLFVQHVQQQRQSFNALLDQPPTAAPNPELAAEAAKLGQFPPQDLGVLSQELVDRLSSLKSQAELLAIDVDDDNKNNEVTK